MDKENILGAALDAHLEMAYSNPEDRVAAMIVINEIMRLLLSKYVIIGIVGEQAVIEENHLPLKDKRFIECLRAIANMLEVTHDMAEKDDK